MNYWSHEKENPKKLKVKAHIQSPGMWNYPNWHVMLAWIHKKKQNEKNKNEKVVDGLAIGEPYIFEVASYN
jgi:hypothetical protein